MKANISSFFVSKAARGKLLCSCVDKFDHFCIQKDKSALHSHLRSLGEVFVPSQVAYGPRGEGATIEGAGTMAAGDLNIIF